MWSVIRRGTVNSIFGENDTNKRGKFKILDFHGDPPLFPPSVGHPDRPIRKALVRVSGMLTVMILERVSESSFFQSKRFTTCKVRDENEVTNLNLLHIIYEIK